MSLSVKQTITITNASDGSLVIEVCSDGSARAKINLGRDTVEVSLPLEDLAGFAEAVDKAYRKVMVEGFRPGRET